MKSVQLVDKASVFAALAAVFVIGSGFAPGETREDVANDSFWRDYYTVRSVQVEEVKDEGLGEMGNLDYLAVPVFESLLHPETGDSHETFDGGLSEAAVVLDQIINLGEKVWKIIDANKPVVNVESVSASALPQGVSGWLDLQGWQAPSSKVYRVKYENVYGMDVVSFTYRVIYTYGGSYDGQGRFLARVAVLPANLDVAWGYTFNAKAEVPLVTNAGSRTQPLAAAEVQVKWSVDTVMKHNRMTDSFYLRGDGHFQKLQ